MIIYDYYWSQCSLEVFCVTVFSGEHQVCFHAISLPSGQAREVDLRITRCVNGLKPDHLDHQPRASTCVSLSACSLSLSFVILNVEIVCTLNSFHPCSPISPISL